MEKVFPRKRCFSGGPKDAREPTVQKYSKNIPGQGDSKPADTESKESSSHPGLVCPRRQEEACSEQEKYDLPSRCPEPEGWDEVGGTGENQIVGPTGPQ